MYSFYSIVDVPQNKGATYRLAMLAGEPNYSVYYHVGRCISIFRGKPIGWLLCQLNLSAFSILIQTCLNIQVPYLSTFSIIGIVTQLQLDYFQVLDGTVWCTLIRLKTDVSKFFPSQMRERLVKGKMVALLTSFESLSGWELFQLFQGPEPMS